MFKKVLVLSPHTDDAELGAGATLARFVEEGVAVHVAVFSTCEESLPDAAAPGELLREFHNAFDVLGVPQENRSVHHYPVRRLIDHRQEVLESLVKLRKDLNPDLVLLPSSFDLHQDHQVVQAEGVRAFMKYASIWGYELPWNHRQFTPTHFVKVSQRHMDTKLSMLQCYRTQVELDRIYFQKDFIEGLGRVRGVQSQCEYSESFEVIRSVY